MTQRGVEDRIRLALVELGQARGGFCATVLDPDGMLTPHGVRSVSKTARRASVRARARRAAVRARLRAGESTTALFGGNSNWRGPVWFPLNYLLIEALQKHHYFLGDEFKVECPTGSDHEGTLWDVTTDLTCRLITLFLRDENGRRPVNGDREKFQSDPHWRDLILFHEYFHGDTGAGLGASHQTGWTGVVAKLIHQYAEYALQRESPRAIEREALVIEGVGHGGDTAR